MSDFSEKLINWYSTNKRNLPWRKTKNPYAIWLSEIILQQTRVEQGLPYWERFMYTFPTVKDLAEAEEEQVLRLWQGLGYYSRARNLHATAKYIYEDLKGFFPNTYKEIIKLKGIGPYTAAAISSFCFNEPVPVVDGNVFRFAGRYFGIEEDIAQAKTRKSFEEILKKHIDQNQPDIFNQAIMEYGGSVCAPKADCPNCTFNMSCYAYLNEKVSVLPIKIKKLKVTNKYFHYLVITDGEMLLMKKRTEDGIWKNLFDFWMIDGKMGEESVLLNANEQGISGLVKEISRPVKHLLSHQRIEAKFYKIQVSSSDLKEIAEKTELQAFTFEEIVNLPKPKLIVNYLSNY